MKRRTRSSRRSTRARGPRRFTERRRQRLTVVQRHVPDHDPRRGHRGVLTDSSRLRHLAPPPEVITRACPRRMADVVSRSHPSDGRRCRSHARPGAGAAARAGRVRLRHRAVKPGWARLAELPIAARRSGPRLNAQRVGAAVAEGLARTRVSPADRARNHFEATRPLRDGVRRDLRTAYADRAGEPQARSSQRPAGGSGSGPRTDWPGWRCRI